MDTYITGQTIKNLREKKGFTQAELAEKLGVSSKAVSKWETAKGLPDIALIEPLANVLSVSVMELMTGNAVVLDVETDAGILGGIIVEIDGKVIDGSLQNRLNLVKDVIGR